MPVVGEKKLVWLLFIILNPFRLTLRVFGHGKINNQVIAYSTKGLHGV